MEVRALCRLGKIPKSSQILYRRSFILSALQQLELSDLKSSLLQRKFPIIYDQLVRPPAQKLSASLASFLPERWLPYLKVLEDPRGRHKAFPLPPAFHLVYFNPALPASSLLPDGTDPAQSPGAPYVRRMWAGGSVQFHQRAQVLCNGGLYACLERITDVKIKGPEGEEKIFVTIERRIGPATGDEKIDRRTDEQPTREGGFEHALIIEERNIVFMRARTAAELNEAKKNLEIYDLNQELGEAAKSTPKAVFKASTPDFSHTLTPTPSLLFRYSALTFNAHAIHLDKSYCRDVEAHRNLLFHGPLSVTLLATGLEAHIKKTRGFRYTISKIDYRNIAPLYVDEPMRICGNMSKTGDYYHLWIENSEGVQAVRATATVQEQKSEELGFDESGSLDALPLGAAVALGDLL